MSPGNIPDVLVQLNETVACYNVSMKGVYNPLNACTYLKNT